MRTSTRTEIGARLTFMVNAHAVARRRRRVVNVGRVLFLKITLTQTSGGRGGDSTSVECMFSMTPHTDARRRRGLYNVGRVLVDKKPPLIQTRGGGGGGYSASAECLFSMSASKEEEEEEENEGIQRRSSACSQ